MTDARLAAAVEAAARVFYGDRRATPGPGLRMAIEAALAAADAWGREQGVVRVRAIHDGTPGPDEPRDPRPVPR